MEKVTKLVSKLGIKAAKDEAKIIKPGKTKVSPLASARGRIVGGGMGGMFGIKNR